MVRRRSRELGQRIREGNVGNRVGRLLTLCVEGYLEFTLASPSSILLRLPTLNWKGYSYVPALIAKLALGFAAKSSGRTFVGNSVLVL
jgi:hypothetical protein